MTCTVEDFAFLRWIVLEQSANCLDPSRDYLLASRLQTVLRHNGFDTLGAMVAALRQCRNVAVERSIAEAMTVNENSFFRDRLLFELIRLELIPQLIRQRMAVRSLRLWSAACSTGQEAYSLAMTISEHFPELRDWHVQIVGTDICGDAIARAKEGKYQRHEVDRGLPSRLLAKYLRPAGADWEVVPVIKRMCWFQQRNLCSEAMSMPKFDGILLRNVMLYFSDAAREQLLLKIHVSVASDGFLILGSSEQPEMPNRFQPVIACNTCYYRPLCC